MATTISGPVLKCENCNETHLVVMPIPLDHFIKVLKAFDSLHKYCKKTTQKDDK